MSSISKDCARREVASVVAAKCVQSRCFGFEGGIRVEAKDDGLNRTRNKSVDVE
jgi:hypothetical protein